MPHKIGSRSDSRVRGHLLINTWLCIIALEQRRQRKETVGGKRWGGGRERERQTNRDRETKRERERERELSLIHISEPTRLA